MAKYNVVLFDIDDVLLKTSKVKWAQHKFVAKKYYNIDLTDATLGEHWGKPFHRMIEQLYEQADTPDNMAQNFARHELEFRKELMPDTLATLKTLHKTGVAMGLITSMRWEIAKIEIELLRLPLGYFAVVQGCDESEFHKPDPRVFDPALQTLAKLGYQDRTKIVYIGDAPGDFAAAHGAGLDFIGVATGLTTAQALRAAGAKRVVPKLRDILPLVA